MDRRASPPPETTPSWAAGARRRIPFYLLAAFLLAGLAAIATFVYLERMWAAAVPTSQAVVARVAIRPGTLIDETMVEARPVPQAVVPSNRLTSISQAVGRVAIVPIAISEVILPDKLSGGPEGGLSRRLPDGRWAMVLPSGWLASPLPELSVGDRLDLLAYQPGQEIKEAGLIVTAVEVIGITGPFASADSLTLAVTLEEAAAVVYARANGFLLLALLRPAGG